MREYDILMFDETYIKINSFTVTQVAEKIEQKIADANDRSLKFAAREHYYGELLAQLRVVINDIIVRARQQSSVPNGFYEKELSELLQKINKVVAESRDEAMKMHGAVEAYKVALCDVKDSTTLFETEAKKAKDIQARAESGELDKPRKVGVRPDRLKDIRNYAKKDDDK